MASSAVPASTRTGTACPATGTGVNDEASAHAAPRAAKTASELHNMRIEGSCSADAAARCEPSASRYT